MPNALVRTVCIAKPKITAALLITISAVAMSAAPLNTDWHVNIRDRTVRIDTHRWQVTLQDGLVVELINNLTGEIHARAGSAPPPSVPSGLGVQTGALEQARELHSVWRQREYDSAHKGDLFPSQHRPYANSLFTCRQSDIHTLSLTYKGLAAGGKEYPDEMFALRVSLEPQTGDLLLSASGASPLAGVYGAMIGVVNIDKDTTAQVAHFGGVRFDRNWPSGQYSLQDGGPFFEAPVVALEGKLGSWAIWAEDANFGPKGLYWQNTPAAFNLLLESRNLSPFDSYRETTSVTWHLNCARGSWVTAARFYREWFQRAFAGDLAARTPAWARRIRVVSERLPMTAAQLTSIAAVVDPGTVLLNAWDPRRPAFGQDLPDFTPRQSFVDGVKLSHEHGFRTSGYVNTYCISKNSPMCLTRHIQDFILLPTRLFEPAKTLSDWKDGDIIYTDPLSPRWREFHAASMKEFVDATKTDALYEDVAGVSGDHGNGVVDGIYAGRGSYEALRAVHRVLPFVPLATEYNTEPIAPFSTWPLRGNYFWGNDGFRDALSLHASPFEAYIFGPDVLVWTQVNPTAATTAFHRGLDYADAVGGLAWLLGPEWIHVTRGDQALALSRARLFSNLQLRPYFPETKWPKDVVAFYQDESGGTYKVVERDGQAFLGPDDREIYRRTRNLTHVKTSLVIPGWPAYDSEGPIGLNPAVKYSLIRGERLGTKVKISALSNTTCIQSYRQGDNFVVLGLGCGGEGSSARTDFTYQLPATTYRALVNGVQQEPRQIGQNLTLSVPVNATVVWLDRLAPAPDKDGYLGSGSEDGQLIADGSGISVDPERSKLLRFGTEKGPGVLAVCPSPGVELTMDYPVRVPSNSSVLRVFGVHLSTQYGDGMTAKLLLNGRPIFVNQMGPKDNRWRQWDIPLGRYAGQPVLITLAANPNKDTNSDNLRLTRPKIIDAPAITEPADQVLESGK